VPMQLMRPLTTMSGARSRFCFPVEVPPLGYRTYRVRLGELVLDQHKLSASATTLENEHLLLELDPATGRIARLVHKASGADLAAPGSPHAVVIDDRSDTWGHGVVAYDRVAGEFACTGVTLLEQGPVRAILRVESAYGSSTLREDYVLSADAAHVDVRVALDWHEPLKLLKLRWPTPVETDVATFETPYGRLERETNGHEEPGQSWVDVSDGSKGLTVINDSKHGYDVRGGDIGISAVRSPVWAWHDPRELEEGGDFEYMDLGRQTFLVRLVPHGGDLRAADVVRRAAELNQPPFALIETFHEGPLPLARSFADDGGGDVVLTVVKGGEDGGYAMRAYETAGGRTHARLDVLGTAVEADFGAHEIKTFVLRDGAAVETDLLEW
jgi:alpha-mannosidase